MKPEGYTPPPDLRFGRPRGRGSENQEITKKQRDEDGVSSRRQQLMEKLKSRGLKNLKSKDIGAEVPVKKRKAAVDDVGRRRAEITENQDAGK